MATQEELLRSQQIGQRIRDIFGPLPGSGKGLDRLAGIPYGLLAQIYGGAADITGGIGSTFGLDEFAVDQYNRADDAYKAAMDKYTKGFGGSGGFQTILKPAPYSPDIPENPLADLSPGKLPTPVPPPSAQQMGIDFTTPLTSPAYSQDDINKLLSDLPKPPTAIPESDFQKTRNIEAEKAREEANRLTDPKGGDKSLAGGAEAIEGLMNKSIMDYIDNIRGTSPEQAQKVKTLAKYKEEFAEATGLDVSGKQDTKDALVAFGLALMQNKAGKKFNVGNILKATGEAGEKAMPLLQKAKADAKAVALSAGKYALEMRSADTTKAEAAKEKAMNRSQFYIYEKGGKGTPFENFDNGDLEYVSLYELDALMKDPNFNKQYSFMPADKYFDILKGEAKDTDLGNAYSKSTKISLLGGDVEDVDSIYIVDGQRPDGNYKGQRKKHSYLQSNPETVVANLVKEQNSILREQEKFKGLIGDIKTGVSIPKQLGSSIIQFGRNLGLDIGDGPTSIAQAKKKLEAIQLQEATNILKESGKTLSDQDRERVKRFVGTIDLTSADPALIMQSLGRVYELILVARQRNLNTAKTNLNETFGVSFEESITQEELDLINEKRKKDGLELRTMDDFK